MPHSSSHDESNLICTVMTSGELTSILDQETTIQVSSTLEKSTGKKNLIDNSPETCWTSQQGLPQFVQFRFTKRVMPKRLSIIFQGGFVGTRCAVCIPMSSDEAAKKDWQALTYIYPEDVNRRQVFELECTKPDLIDGGVTGVKLVFEESSDFFGRITVYDLRLEGTIVQ
ncbi:hypothetical protein B0H34DRAFT_19325 [Crassisporium funariophilum]|nr:hypothetical protein B0H34DRAFT_19325 [Crassisporium funariophilum]